MGDVFIKSELLFLAFIENGWLCFLFYSFILCKNPKQPNYYVKNRDKQEGY